MKIHRRPSCSISILMVSDRVDSSNPDHEIAFSWYHIRRTHIYIGSQSKVLSNLSTYKNVHFLLILVFHRKPETSHWSRALNADFSLGEIFWDVWLVKSSEFWLLIGLSFCMQLPVRTRESPKTSSVDILLWKLVYKRMFQACLLFALYEVRQKSKCWWIAYQLKITIDMLNN